MVKEVKPMHTENDLLASLDLRQDEAPHFRQAHTSQKVMIHVLIALIFPTLAGMYFFGWMRVLLMVIVGISSAIFFEFIYSLWSKRPVNYLDGSAAVTGYLIALSLPSTAPLWTLLLGTAFAILIVKQADGGLGRNRFNPAVSARVMQKLLLTPWITQWVLPGPDAISTATPLESIGHFAQSVPDTVPSLTDLFFGFNLGGPIGETSKFAILFSFIYLVLVKVIKPTIPLVYMLTIAILASLWSSFDLQFIGSHLLSGTLVFGAVFMVTDYSSTPISPKGHHVFAIGAATITFIIRIIFNFPGGFGFGVLIMNAFTPWIDKHFAPRIYGHQEAPQVIDEREPLHVKTIK